MPISRVFSVKSNAARNAKGYGIGREAMRAVPGGWVFDIPEGATPAAKPVLITDPSHPDYDARTLAEGINGDDGSDGVDVAAVIDNAFQAAHTAKPRKTTKPAKAKPAKKPKAVKAAKPAKAPKVKKPRKAAKAKKSEHGKYPGSPAFQNRRPSQGKSGAIATVVKELSARWTPAKKLMKELGWVSNTFRGVLGKLRADGVTVEYEQRDGEPYYRIV